MRLAYRLPCPRCEYVVEAARVSGPFVRGSAEGRARTALTDHLWLQHDLSRPRAEAMAEHARGATLEVPDA